MLGTSAAPPDFTPVLGAAGCCSTAHRVRRACQWVPCNRAGRIGAARCALLAASGRRPLARHCCAVAIAAVNWQQFNSAAPAGARGLGESVWVDTVGKRSKPHLFASFSPPLWLQCNRSCCSRCDVTLTKVGILSTQMSCEWRGHFIRAYQRRTKEQEHHTKPPNKTKQKGNITRAA
jgi:hypothetical protein